MSTDSERGDVRVVQQESLRDRAPEHWQRRLPQSLLPLHSLQENSQVRRRTSSSM